MNCCRLCGRENEHLECIFDRENLSENVHRYLQIQILEEDALSHYVCKSCEETVKKIMHYVLDCQQKQRELNKLLSLEYTKMREETVKIETEPVDNADGVCRIKCEVVDEYPDVCDVEVTSEDPLTVADLPQVIDEPDDFDVDNTLSIPGEIHSGDTETINFSSLPEKSRRLYENSYRAFQEWKTSKNISASHVSENTIIAYFKELSEKYAPPTLWSRYSMLRATMDHYDNIQIANYTTLKMFIKRMNVGYIKKKAKAFTAAEVSAFLNQAPNEIYLVHKVVMIFGVSGAMRSGDELTNVRIQHIEKQGSVLLVQVPKTNNQKPRSFVIHKDHAAIVKKYEDLRPSFVPTDRFFLNYQGGRCTRQVIGRNKFARMPRETAKYLRLPNPNLYTGHSYRRTSAAILGNSKADLFDRTRLGGCDSHVVTEFTNETPEQRSENINILASKSASISLPSTSCANNDIRAF